MTDAAGSLTKGKHPRWIAYVLMGAILLAALFVRLYSLVDVPPGLQADEMFNALDASRIRIGNTPVFFPANFGREALFIYVMALSVKLLGTGTWATRLPAVFFSLVTILFTYRLVSRLHGFRIAIIATALLAVSFWPIMTGRVGLRAIALPACQVVATYALDRALRDHAWWWAVGAGISIGLLPYTYLPGYVFPAVLALWVLCCRPPQGMKRLFLIAALALIVFSPLGLYLLQRSNEALARVDALSFELNQLRAGNLEPAWRSTRAVLRMFTWFGDPDWRYNVSLRPVFDWVTGCFFYLGIVAVLARVRRPASVLWLLWLLIMLLPAMLTGNSPSFLRSTGAMVPIYVLPAIGVNSVLEIGERLARPVVRTLSPLLVGVGLLAVAADSWQDYFCVWGKHPAVWHIYESDLAAAARFLNAYEDDTTPVWISSEYAYDLSRVIFDMQSDYAGPVRWFNGQQGTVWPAATYGRDVLLIYTESCLPLADAEPILQPYAIHREDTPAGSPNLLVYRLPLAVLEDPPWQGTHLAGRFADGVAVLGFDAPDEGERGAVIPFMLYWRVLADHRYEQSDPPYTSVCLEDGAGHCWSETVEFVPYPMQDWTEGDTFAQHFDIPIPPDVPPQPMVFRVRQFNSKREYVFASPERGGVPLRVGALQVTGVVTTALHWADDTSLHGDLALLDASLPRPLIHAGAEIPVILSWQAVRQPAADYAARFELRAGAGTGLVYTETLWGGLYPTSVWAAGEQVRTWHEIPVPRDLPAGEFDLALTLLDPAGSPQGAEVALGTLTVMSRQHSFELPTPQFSLEARFGTAIRLLGYDLHPAEPVRGGQVEVTLYWQAIEPIEKDYKVFVHLYPSLEGNVIVAQHDSPPANGQAPTSTWLPGEVVTDVHLIPLPGEIESRRVTVAVGLYLPETAERLLLSSNGEGQWEDRLRLTEIEIR